MRSTFFLCEYAYAALSIGFGYSVVCHLMVVLYSMDPYAFSIHLSLAQVCSFDYACAAAPIHRSGRQAGNRSLDYDLYCIFSSVDIHQCNIPTRMTRENSEKRMKKHENSMWKMRLRFSSVRARCGATELRALAR